MGVTFELVISVGQRHDVTAVPLFHSRPSSTVDRAVARVFFLPRRSKLQPEWPNPEAHMAESEGGVLWEGGSMPSPPARVPAGVLYKLPMQWVRGGVMLFSVPFSVL